MVSSVSYIVKVYMQTINFSPRALFSEDEADLVRKVLLFNKVNYWTGSEGKSFEKEFSEWVATKYVIALANGTIALNTTLQGLGIGAGDEVIVTSRTFIFSTSSIVWLVHLLVFVIST